MLFPLRMISVGSGSDGEAIKPIAVPFTEALIPDFSLSELLRSPAFTPVSDTPLQSASPSLTPML